MVLKRTDKKSIKENHSINTDIINSMRIEEVPVEKISKTTIDHFNSMNIHPNQENKTTFMKNREFF
jgi:hypothetical protein